MIKQILAWTIIVVALGVPLVAGVIGCINDPEERQATFIMVGFCAFLAAFAWALTVVVG